MEVNKEQKQIDWVKLNDEFIDGLRRHDSRYDLHIYYNIFSIIEQSDPNFIENLILYNFKQYGSDGWYYHFNKQFRQVDIIDDNKIASVIPVITEEELVLKRTLFNKIQELKNKYSVELYGENYDKNPPFSEIEKFYEVKEPNYSEYKKTVIKLNAKSQTYKINYDTPISGHLDSIIWHTISNDNSGGLSWYIEKFMEKHLVEYEKQ